MYVSHIFMIIFCPSYITLTGGNPPSRLDFSRSGGGLTFFALRRVEFVSEFRKKTTTPTSPRADKISMPKSHNSTPKFAPRTYDIL